MTSAEYCAETFEDALLTSPDHCRAQIKGLSEQRAGIWAAHPHTPFGDEAVRVITREIRAWTKALRELKKSAPV